MKENNRVARTLIILHSRIRRGEEKANLQKRIGAKVSVER